MGQEEQGLMLGAHTTRRDRRYRDLESEVGQAHVGDATGDDNSDSAESQRPTAVFGAVHFSFGDPAPAGGSGGGGGGSSSSAAAAPPEVQALAETLGLPPGSEVPRSRKQHQVVERTARFVLDKGGKMEAMLKVKHGGNRAFGFLLVDDPLQAPPPPHFLRILTTRLAGRSARPRATPPRR
jgi:hypothetical protein